MKSRVDLEVKAVNKWRSLYNRAALKDIPFDLTVAEIKTLLKKKRCEYTGVSFASGGLNTQTFDKVTPEKGYVKSNIKVCTLRMNRAKKDLSLREIKQLYKVLIEDKEIQDEH